MNEHSRKQKIFISFLTFIKFYFVILFIAIKIGQNVILKNIISTILHFFIQIIQILIYQR
jgi:hypothetical protein